MSEGDAHDALRMIALLRPEGPTLSSHVRKGVERSALKYPEARRAGSHRETNNSRFMAHLRRLFVLSGCWPTPSRTWLLSVGPSGLSV